MRDIRLYFRLASATLSCIGTIMEPRMTAAGYEKGYTAALLACACPLGLLIPPSSAQILYAWSSGSSVLACFLSTIGPGLLLTLLLCIVNVVLVKNMDIKSRLRRVITNGSPIPRRACLSAYLR